jgi:ribose 5-phosphate isomerase A
VLRKRPDGARLVTDNGNYILDAHLGAIAQPEALAVALGQVPGVVEHGLFIGLASGAILAGADGLRLLGATG